jgi:hypothetical protein
MKSYLYLSLLPESLIASMLPPEQFGTYMATGTTKQPHGQAMFLQIRRDFQSEDFDLAKADARCIPFPDGRPKNSVYLAIYRVLERIPLEAIESLWLVTAHGRCLELKPGQPPKKFPGKYHLYREICPVHPLIASSLNPLAFTAFITSPAQSIYVPKILFVELALNGLGDDPRTGRADNLPYNNIDHLRSCLTELASKQTKTVDRVAQQGIIYRCVKSGSGFFLGDQQRVIYFPYPNKEDFEGRYNVWWRCANDSELQYAAWSV